MLGTGMRRGLIVAFMALCFGAIAFANRPPSMADAVDRRLDESLSPRAAWRVRYAGWLLQRCAHLAGLDNRWEMFGRQSRFNWRYEIVGRYGAGGEWVLPLPRQSERTLAQYLLLDFKEPKLALNLYADPARRERWAQYLCRRFPLRGGHRMEDVVIDLRWRELRSRVEASATGTSLAPEAHVQPLDVFPCIWPEDAR
jgi:hypothetical protein